MNETCQVNLSPFACGDDDPRYEPCGRPARFKVGETWICADHHDEFVKGAGTNGQADDALDSIGGIL